MIKKLSFISVFILLFCTVSVSAQDAENKPSSRNDGLDQRVTERLKNLTADLDDNEIKALKAKCKAAQNRIRFVRQAADTYYSGRSERVDKILDDLSTLSETLKGQGVEAGSIDKKIEEITQLREKADATYKNYLLAVNDSVAINCETSPEGFRLSVDDAKKQFSDLQELRSALTNLIKVELRQDLTGIKDNL
ncbi:MAG TPA: hypothetical protein VFX79_01620 [Candidatus Saccharimonadales bacterium]|nr:hypothetical protein [Candidatus Saccharimonadales bacterium]